MVRQQRLVSVVIPTYNRGDTIKKSIDSVLAQIYKNLEVIVVDDGSTDNTQDVVESYVDPKVRYVKLPKNRGANVARNTGIKRAKGEFIAFLDSDDRWEPEKISKQMEVYENSSDDIKVVYCGEDMQSDKGNRFYMPEKWVNPKEGDVFRPLLRGNFVGTVSLLVKKECFEEVGYFDEELPRAQDWDMALRLAKEFKFKLVDEPLVTVYYSQDSISSDYEALANALEKLFDKHRKNFMSNKDIFSSHHFWLASVYFTLREWDKGIEYIRKAYTLKPFHPLTIMRLLASLFGSDFYKNFRGLLRRVFL